MTAIQITSLAISAIASWLISRSWSPFSGAVASFPIGFLGGVFIGAVLGSDPWDIGVYTSALFFSLVGAVGGATYSHKKSKTPTTASEGDLWWYSVDGSSKDKASHQDFSELVRSRKIPAVTLVWKHGMPDWIPLSDLPASIFEAPNILLDKKNESLKKPFHRFALAALTLLVISIVVTALFSFRTPPMPKVDEQASINTRSKTDTTSARKKSDVTPSGDQSIEISKSDDKNRASRLWNNPISGAKVEVPEPWQFNVMKSEIGEVLISIKSESSDRSLYLISKANVSVEQMSDKYAVASSGGIYEMPKLDTEGAWQIAFIKCAPEFCQKAPAFNVFFKRSDQKEAHMLYAGAFRKSSTDRSALVSVCSVSAEILATSGLGGTDWLSKNFPLLCNSI